MRANVVQHHRVISGHNVHQGMGMMEEDHDATGLPPRLQLYSGDVLQAACVSVTQHWFVAHVRIHFSPRIVFMFFFPSIHIYDI